VGLVAPQRGQTMMQLRIGRKAGKWKRSKTSAAPQTQKIIPAPRKITFALFLRRSLCADARKCGLTRQDMSHFDTKLDECCADLGGRIVGHNSCPRFGPRFLAQIPAGDLAAEQEASCGAAAPVLGCIIPTMKVVRPFGGMTSARRLRCPSLPLRSTV